MKFRTALVLGNLVLITAMAMATVAAVSNIVNHEAERAVAANLQRSLDVFAELQTYRRALLRAKAQILAEEPRFRAVLATTDISAATVHGVVQDLSRTIEVELFVVVDADGVVLADVGNGGATGQDLSGHLLVAGAQRHGLAGGTWVSDSAVYQAQAVRVGFGDEIIGVAIVGYRVDSRVAESAHALTASTIAIQHRDQLIAMWPPGNTSAATDRLSRELAKLSGKANAPAEIHIDGTPYLAASAQFPGHEDSTQLRYTVLRSLDRALAPGRRVQTVLFLTAALALLFALFFAVMLARRLARPIDRLVAFTERIAAGDLQARAQIDGTAGAIELCTLARAMNHMAAKIDESQHHIAARERLEKEMEIAARIQTSILPRQLDAPGLDMAAVMVTADDVGGDYYDVLVRDHTWIAIGDVAGHGVPAGLVMMMVQNVLSAVIQVQPDAAPSTICAQANRVLVENVRHRLQRDEHVTITLLRCDSDGRMVFAGAHEDIVVWRTASGACERIATPGTWLAVMDDIDAFLDDHELTLGPDDVMVLYTDGVTEAMNEDREQFGLDRLCAAIDSKMATHPGVAARELCAHILDMTTAWASTRNDDITVMVIRRA